MDNNGQLSAELLFATLILIIIVGSLMNIVSSGIGTADNAEISKAKVLADTISRTINSVYSNGKGQYEVLELPDDFNYTVTINNKEVNVLYENKTLTSSIIPKNHIKSVPITMNPGENYTVTNDNGNITIIGS